MVIGSSTTTFNAGDQITVQVTQPRRHATICRWTPATALAPEMNPNCNGGSAASARRRLRLTLASGAGDRRFVAAAATRRPAGPAGGTLTLLGVPGSSTPAGTGGTIPGFATAGRWHEIDIYYHPSWPRPARAPSPLTASSTTLVVAQVLINVTGATTRPPTTTGPVRQYRPSRTSRPPGHDAVQAQHRQPGAWLVPAGRFPQARSATPSAITTLGMTGPPMAFAVTRRHDRDQTISGITITGSSLTPSRSQNTAGNTFCIDITNNATFAASPSLSVTDLVSRPIC
jgi:hypothetical protein